MKKKEVLKKGIQLHLAHSNNEAEYATLKAGLEECKSMGIKKLMVKEDALLIVRQVQGAWACKNSKLLQWLHEVKLLMKDFEAIQIQHISRQHNKESYNLANTQFEVMVGAIKFKEPLFQGQETMEDILYFLETGECPKHLERVQRHCLGHKIPQCDNPKGMGVDLFPLPLQIPSHAQDYGIEIKKEARPSGLIDKEKGKTKVMSTVCLERGKDDLDARLMHVGKM
ncbi:hypothetical protein L7F22_044811 [Adiantum nelumboides]|nr:hypothetical protein [Adiantum nelumboides]